jgi:energy-coupling factor transporter ATP-binding protein EcfA2
MDVIADYDAPAAIPQFDFDRLATALHATLTRERAESAFVLGLHGPWGSGKTTLLEAIARRLPESAVVVRFNAWKYDTREALWRALILTVLDKLRDEGQLGQVEQDEITEMQRSLYERFSVSERGPLEVDWTAAAAAGVQVAIGAAALHFGGGALLGLAAGLRSFFGQKKDADGKAEDTAKQIERAATILQRKTIERTVQQVVSIEQFLGDFRKIVGKLGAIRRVYVLIDDLDRCLPETALGIFEAIKLFLDAPQCAYVIAVDRAVIRRGLELRYPAKSLDERRTLPPAVDPDEYIEKTVTLSLDLPMLADADGAYLLASGHLAGKISNDAADEIVYALGTNPRRLLRFGTMLTLWLDVAQKLIDEDHRILRFAPLESGNRALFLKLSLIGYLNSALLAEMRRDSELPSRLQKICNDAFAGAQEDAPRAADRAGTLKPDAAKIIATESANEPPVVAQALLDPAVMRALRLLPLLNEDRARVAEALRWFRSAAG